MPNIFMHIYGWLLASACIVSVHAMPTPLSTWSSPVSFSSGLLPRTTPAYIQETVILASTKTRVLIGCLLSLFVVGIVAGVVTLWLCWEKGWVCCGRGESFDEDYQESTLVSTRGLYEKLDHPSRMHQRRERMRAYLEHKTKVEEKVLAWRTQARLPGL